jgi:hypothetical protein
MYAVNEHHLRCSGPRCLASTVDHIALHHYVTKSEEVGGVAVLAARLTAICYGCCMGPSDRPSLVAQDYLAKMALGRWANENHTHLCQTHCTNLHVSCMSI